MATLIPPTPAANKSTEQHEEPSEQDSFNHLLYKVQRLTSQQVQDLNGWMEHRGIPNVHEVIAQNFRKPDALEDNTATETYPKIVFFTLKEKIKGFCTLIKKSTNVEKIKGFTLNNAILRLRTLKKLRVFPPNAP